MQTIILHGDSELTHAKNLEFPIIYWPEIFVQMDWLQILTCNCGDKVGPGAYLGVCQTPMMDLFCKNSSCFLAVFHFNNNSLSHIFDRVLNTPWDAPNISKTYLENVYTEFTFSEITGREACQQKWLSRDVLNIIQDGLGEGGGHKKPPTRFFPLTSTNVGINAENFLTLSFKPFAKLV